MTARRLRFFVRVWTTERLFLLGLGTQWSCNHQDQTADKKTKSHSDSRIPRAPDPCSHALTITASFPALRSQYPQGEPEATTPTLLAMTPLQRPRGTRQRSRSQAVPSFSTAFAPRPSPVQFRTWCPRARAWS